jgi:hypothetical protein
MKVVLFDDESRTDEVEQFLLAHDAVAPLRQRE